MYYIHKNKIFSLICSRAGKVHPTKLAEVTERESKAFPADLHGKYSLPSHTYPNIGIGNTHFIPPKKI